MLGQPVELGGAPTDLDGASDRVVESLALPPRLVRWEPTLSDYEQVAIPIGGIPAELLIDGRGKGWVTDNETGAAQRFDVFTGRALGAAVKLGRKPDGIAVDGDAIWIADRDGKWTA